MLVVLLALGVAALSLCHTDAVPQGGAVSAAPTLGDGSEETASAASAAHDHEEHCDEAGSVLGDQRAGSLSASLLLGMGVFAFLGLPVLTPRPTLVQRSSKGHRTLPLGGTRALVSLCVRRV
ncbi:hypothetical protein GCM10009642_17840 [Nocardiopsis metallicus]